MWTKALCVVAVAASGADAFAPLSAVPSTRRAASAMSGLKMGFFDNIMGNKGQQDFTPPPGEENLTPVVGLQPEQGKVLITFLPSGAQVNARPGENMGDAARRAGLAVPYGCKQGVCGTCEATQRQPTGQNNVIKVCSTKVASSNLDAPDREKMWGDLRGGKKSVSELRSAPQELTVTLANPNIAYKKKEIYEKSKDAIASNTKDWLSPDYKSPGPGAGGAPPPPPQKKGWW